MITSHEAETLPLDILKTRIDSEKRTLNLLEEIYKTRVRMEFKIADISDLPKTTLGKYMFDHMSMSTNPDALERISRSIDRCARIMEMVYKDKVTPVNTGCK